MKSESGGTVLTVVFVDYDNIYLSLKRKNEEAAKRFAKDAGVWLREIESGRLITATNGSNFQVPRRVVMSRCYGNPVPRRNSSDNSTDMNSFPFVRHHFLRAGFEVIDCPPLTAQLKNSADIRMVMDVRDVLNHDTRFDEFIILSGDADFTPVLHRLRAHARRTVVFANDHTAAPYTAISDGEIREADLISLLMEGRLLDEDERKAISDQRQTPQIDAETARRDIITEVSSIVRQSPQPVPLEALADRAIRTLGHDKTAGTSWGGAGSFRELLLKGLPGDIRLTDQPPFLAFDTQRHIAREPQRELEARPELRSPRAEPRMDVRMEPPRSEPLRAPRVDARIDTPREPAYRAEQQAPAPRSAYDRAASDRPNYDAPPAPRYTPRDDARVSYARSLLAKSSACSPQHRSAPKLIAKSAFRSQRSALKIPTAASRFFRAMRQRLSKAPPRAPAYAPQPQPQPQPIAPQARPFTPPPAQAFVPPQQTYAREPPARASSPAADVCSAPQQPPVHAQQPAIRMRLRVRPKHRNSHSAPSIPPPRSSSRSRGSMKPARRRPCRRRSIACSSR